MFVYNQSLKYETYYLIKQFQREIQHKPPKNIKEKEFDCGRVVLIMPNLVFWGFGALMEEIMSFSF
jgi:hypothetical protein